MCSTATHAGLMFRRLSVFNAHCYTLSLSHTDESQRQTKREKPSFSFTSGQDLSGVQMDTVNQSHETNTMSWEAHEHFNPFSTKISSVRVPCWSWFGSQLVYLENNLRNIFLFHRPEPKRCHVMMSPITSLLFSQKQQSSLRWSCAHLTLLLTSPIELHLSKNC